MHKIEKRYTVTTPRSRVGNSGKPGANRNGNANDMVFLTIVPLSIRTMGYVSAGISPFLVILAFQFLLGHD